MATFKYVGGMVGNPDIPNVAWSDEQMQILRDMGMNFAQMNHRLERPAGQRAPESGTPRRRNARHFPLPRGSAE